MKKMEEDKKEEHDVKAQIKVLDETMLMIPHTKTRLEAAIVDLTEYMVRVIARIRVERYSSRIAIKNFS